jgi:hypothetical protein
MVDAGLVKAFADAISLWMLGLGPNVVNLVEAQEDLVRMAIISGTVLRAPIR